MSALRGREETSVAAMRADDVDPAGLAPGEHNRVTIGRKRRFDIVGGVCCEASRLIRTQISKLPAPERSDAKARSEPAAHTVNVRVSNLGLWNQIAEPRV